MRWVLSDFARGKTLIPSAYPNPIQSPSPNQLPIAASPSVLPRTLARSGIALLRTHAYVARAPVALRGRFPPPGRSCTRIRPPRLASRASAPRVADRSSDSCTCAGYEAAASPELDFVSLFHSCVPQSRRAVHDPPLDPAPKELHPRRARARTHANRPDVFSTSVGSQHAFFPFTTASSFACDIGDILSVCSPTFPIRHVSPSQSP